MSKETILVVDDEANIIALAKMYLEKEGYRVERAMDGAEALRKIDELQPALMVLELDEPVDDQTLDKLMALPEVYTMKLVKL